MPKELPNLPDKFVFIDYGDAVVISCEEGCRVALYLTLLAEGVEVDWRRKCRKFVRDHKDCDGVPEE